MSSGDSDKEDDKLQIFLKNKGYTLKKKLGSGGYGKVFSVTKGNKIYALKVIQNEKDEYAGMIKYPIELDILSGIDNKFSIKAEEIFTYNEDGFPGLGILMELANGTLSDLDKLSFDDKLIFLKKVAEGVKCLHCCGILHLDIKSINVLYTSVKNAQPEPIIADFGLSKCVKSIEDGILIERRLGTVSHRAPENLDCISKYKYYYNGASDIWAYGVTVFHIITGTKFLPVELKNSSENISSKRKGKYSELKMGHFFIENLSDHDKRRKYFKNRISKISDKTIPKKQKSLVVDFLTEVLDFDNNTRPNIFKVLSNKIFNGIEIPEYECYLNQPNENITKFIPNKDSIETIIARIAKYMISIAKKKEIRVFILFLAFDIAFRFFLTVSAEFLNNRWNRYLIAISCVDLAIKYNGTRIAENKFLPIIKEDLNMDLETFQNYITWEDIYKLQEKILVSFNYIIHRNYIYEAATSTKKLRSLYNKHVRNPENYYSFTGKFTSPMKFSDTDISYMSVSEFYQ